MGLGRLFRVEKLTWAKIGAVLMRWVIRVAYYI
jgi:hypothetical protein